MTKIRYKRDLFILLVSALRDFIKVYLLYFENCVVLHCFHQMSAFSLLQNFRKSVCMKWREKTKDGQIGKSNKIFYHKLNHLSSYSSYLSDN